MLGSRGRPASPAAEGVVLGGAAFVVYLLTRTRDVGGDGTVFAAAVDRWLQGRPEWPLLLHPHHLLYNPLVAAACALKGVFGGRPFVLDVGAAVSALAAACAVGGVVVLLRRSGVGEGVALLAATVLGLAGGFWTYGTRMEVYSLTAAAVVVWLWFASREEPSGWAVGGALAFAVLAHAAAGLLVLPTAWRLRRRPRRLAPALAVGLGVPALVLVGSFVLLEGRLTPAAWLGGFFTGGEYLQTARTGGVLQALQGLLVWGFYRSVPVLRPEAALWMNRLGSISTVVVAALVALGVWATLRRRSQLALTALAAILAYLPLWLVWDVGNVEHVVAAAPLFAVVIAVGADALPRWIGVTLLGAVAALLVVVNGAASAVPQSRPENGRVWVAAEFVHSHVPADAVLLSLGSDSRLRLGLGYLSGRRVIDLTLAVTSARQQGRSPDVALAYWLSQAEKGRPVWALGDVFEPAGAAWVAELGVSPVAWRTARERLEPGRPVSLSGDAALVAGPLSVVPVQVR